MSASDQIRKALLEDYSGTEKFAEKVGDHLLQLQIQNVYNRLEYYKHITTIVVAVIGFSVVMAEKKGLQDYSTASLAIFSTLVLLLLSHLRENLDSDAIGLKEQQDKYRKVLDCKKNLLQKYIAIPDLEEKHLLAYQAEIEESEEVKKLATDLDKINITEIENRKRMNYFGELVIYLFLSGLYLLALSLLGQSISTFVLVTSLIALFIISFLDLSKIVSRTFSELMYLIKRISK